MAMMSDLARAAHAQGDMPDFQANRPGPRAQGPVGVEGKSLGDESLNASSIPFITRFHDVRQWRTYDAWWSIQFSTWILNLTER